MKIATVKYPSITTHGALTTAAATLHLLMIEKLKMRDTVWDGPMTLPDGQPKGAALVLEERTKGMELEAILADHDDFKNEKCSRYYSEQLWTHMHLYPEVSLRA